MQGFQIYKNLAALNALNPADAEAMFLKCCGSCEWARRMEKARPFLLVEDLFVSAQSAWSSLPSNSRLEAFHAEGRQASSQLWGTDESDDDGLAAARRLYEERFGFIFILNTVGRSVGEMTEICRARSGNSRETELVIAEREYNSIIPERLKRLLEQ